MSKFLTTLKVIAIIICIGGVAIVLFWIHKKTGITFKSVVAFLRRFTQSEPTPEKPIQAEKTSEKKKVEKVEKGEMKHNESANKTVEGIDKLLAELENA